ncbi:MAG: sigma-70 family RNA polymerase sigma factor [Isosphaeraceae bacterium]
MGRPGRLDRETLVAFYIHGQSLIEMADQLDVPLGTVKRRLHTARKRLKIGFWPSPWITRTGSPARWSSRT